MSDKPIRRIAISTGGGDCPRRLNCSGMGRWVKLEACGAIG